MKNEELQSHLKSATRQTAALQSQLSQKTALLSTHCEELQQVRKEQREIADNLVTTREEKKEKQTTISSLQDRVRLEMHYV